MTWRALLLLMIFLATALSGGCNRKHEREVKKQRIEDSARAKLDAGPALPKLNVVASKGNCAPKGADNLAVFGSCCNNLSCNGQCVKDDEGKIGCACFDVKGGCQKGTVCGKIRRGCVDPKDAQLP